MSFVHERAALFGKLGLAMLVIVGCMNACSAVIRAEPLSKVERALSLLPPDTETIVVANGPFGIPLAFPTHEPATDPATDKEVDQLFQSLPIALLDIEDGLLTSRLKGQQVTVAVEGSRHARSPRSLGGQPYEGAAIVMFAPEADINANEVLRGIQPRAIRSEEIQGTHVLVFREKREDDFWTTFVAFPEGHLLIVATDRRYIEEVLARRAKTQRAALPDSLPEWRFVDRTAAYWGMRHYDRNQAQNDPSSPFGGRKAANFPDELAIGMGFSVSSTNPRRVTLTYLSQDAGMMPAKSPFGALATSPDAKGIEVRFVQIAPGIVQASCSFKSVEAMDTLIFFLEGFLGHAIYL